MVTDVVFGDIIPEFDVIEDDEVDKSLTTEALLVVTTVDAVSAPESSSVENVAVVFGDIIPEFDVIEDDEVDKSLTTEALLVVTTVDAVNAPKSSTVEKHIYIQIKT